MLTICWIASSCPTIIRRKLPSRASASRPVRFGSKGTLTRNIFFWAPFTTTPYFPRANSLPYCGTLVKALLSWLCWPDFDPAYQSPFWHSQQHQYNLPNLFGSDLPISFCCSCTKVCIDASWHNVRDSHVVVAMIQHHCFGETIQSKLRRVVSGATSETILPCQTAYVDDVTAATILHASQRFTRAIKRSREIRLDGLPPFFHAEFHRTFHYAQARIVDQNIGTSGFLVHPIKQCFNLCASSYIGSFAHHFTFGALGEAAYSFVHPVLAASADCHRGAGVGQRARNRKANASCGSRHNRGLSVQKLFIHESILLGTRPVGRALQKARPRVRARAYYPQTRLVNWVILHAKPSRTAQRVAMRRAAHQLLDDPRVFNDPLAAAIAGESEPPDSVEHPFSRALRAFLAVRSRYAEDQLARAVERGVLRQYVVLGAGLDTFAYRSPFRSSGLHV